LAVVRAERTADPLVAMALVQLIALAWQDGGRVAGEVMAAGAPR